MTRNQRDGKRNQPQRKLCLERLEYRELLAAQPISEELIAARFADFRPADLTTEVRLMQNDVLAEGGEGQGDRVGRVTRPFGIRQGLQIRGFGRPNLSPVNPPPRPEAFIRGQLAARLVSRASELLTSRIDAFRSVRAGVVAAEIERREAVASTEVPLRTDDGIGIAPLSEVFAQLDGASEHQEAPRVAASELERPSFTVTLAPHSTDHGSMLQSRHTIDPGDTGEDWRSVLEALALDTASSESGQEKGSRFVSIVASGAEEHRVDKPVNREADVMSDWSLFRFWDTVPSDVNVEFASDSVSEDAPPTAPEVELRVIELAFADDLDDGMVAIDTLAAVSQVESDTEALGVTESAVEIDRISGRVQAFDIDEIDAAQSRVAQLPVENESQPVATTIPNSDSPTRSEVNTSQASAHLDDHRAAGIPALLLLLDLWHSRQQRSPCPTARRPQWFEMWKVRFVKHLALLSFFKKATKTV